MASEATPRIPRFVAPLLGGASLAVFALGIGFKVAEQETLASLGGGPGIPLTQPDSFARAQRMETYSRVAFALFLGAAALAAAAIIVAIFTPWDD